MKFFHPLLVFFLHIGYFGPLLMGVLDSSFLVLPFGNDLLVVWLVAQRHHGAPWYVLSAAAGSTLGALVLALVARKVGERGIRKLAGDKRYKSLSKRVTHRAWLAVVLGGLAPPPFPYSLVIAAAGALDRSLIEILVSNFCARGARFALLAWLAVRFGPSVLQVVHSAPFRWSMTGFIALCLVASGFSIWNWIRHTRSGRSG
ncbi:MAG TPA: VTT domain-containing protein [Acidobacteriaceae bacterium]|nr:VTT domain-containing protein [Acidobacteriaceae bacterium]